VVQKEGDVEESPPAPEHLVDKMVSGPGLRDVHCGGCASHACARACGSCGACSGSGDASSAGAVPSISRGCGSAWSRRRHSWPHCCEICFVSHAELHPLTVIASMMSSHQQLRPQLHLASASLGMAA